MNACRIDRVIFRRSRDSVHHRHRFDRILSGRAFCRQHDRVGPVVNRRCDVADLGTRRRGRHDHRFQHLRRHHHRLASLARIRDDPVLRRGHVLGRKLDPQIAARHHYRIGQLDDGVELSDRRRFLDLGQQRRPVADDRARFGHVFGPLDEAQRNPVHSLFQRKSKVAAVLFGQCRDRHHHVGHVDALVVRHPPADFDHRRNLVAVDRHDPQSHLAVVDQQPVALAHRGEQFGMRQFDPIAIACLFVTVEHEHLPGAEHRRPVLEFADPKLGPLQIDQDGRRPLGVRFQVANRLHQFDFVGLRAVAHVDPEGIRPGVEQFANHLGAAARRAKRCENAHLARARMDLGRHAAPHNGSPPIFNRQRVVQLA